MARKPALMMERVIATAQGHVAVGVGQEQAFVVVQ